MSSFSKRAWLKTAVTLFALATAVAAVIETVNAALVIAAEVNKPPAPVASASDKLLLEVRR